MRMGPNDNQGLLFRDSDNVQSPLHGSDDEFFDILVLALEEVAGLQTDGASHHEPDDF
jgi:hypothetical protein